MKTASCSALVLVVFLGAAAMVPFAGAANIVYELAPFSTDNYSTKSGGTITTNGTIGELENSDIVSASVTITDGSDEIELESVDIANVQATTTSLYLPDFVFYNSSFLVGNGVDSYVVVSLRTHTGAGTETSLLSSGIAFEGASEFEDNYFHGPADYVFADVIPEPAGLGLLALGAGSLVLLRRRKR